MAASPPPEKAWPDGSTGAKVFYRLRAAHDPGWRDAGHVAEVFEASDDYLTVSVIPEPQQQAEAWPERAKPADRARAAGIQLWAPVYHRGKGVGMEQTDAGTYIGVEDLSRIEAAVLQQQQGGVEEAVAVELKRRHATALREALRFAASNPRMPRDIYLDALAGSMALQHAGVPLADPDPTDLPAPQQGGEGS